MKVSQLTTDEALNVMCEITPYLSNIAADEKVVETIGKAISTEGMTRAGIMLVGAEKLNKIVSILLEGHRDDVYGIVAAVNQMDAEEIKRQNFIKTGLQIREICKDKELLDFFKSWVQPESNE